MNTDIPLGDPALFATPCDAAFAELRRAEPVAWQPAPGFWVLTGHAEVQRVSKDPETFCSSRGVLIGDLNREIAAADSILYIDPPRHATYRGLVNRAFTSRRVAQLEPRIRALTVELLDAIDPSTPVDVVDAITAPLPLLVIAELLGLPRADRDMFRVWSDSIMEAATDLTEENAKVALEVFVYFDRLLERRRADPGEDLLSALVDAEVDGDRLTRQEQLGFCMTLLVAGNETTRGLMTGGLVALAENPDQRAILAADPTTVPSAVDEMLRWVSPIMAMARTATRDTTIGAATIKQGDYVVMVYGAANRDGAAFGENADRFDVSRAPNPHLSFGIGEHFCLGASLAVLEANVFFTELLARWPQYRIAGAVTRPPSTLLRQISSVPVLFDPS